MHDAAAMAIDVRPSAAQERVDAVDARHGVDGRRQGLGELPGREGPEGLLLPDRCAGSRRGCGESQRRQGQSDALAHTPSIQKVPSQVRRNLVKF